MKRCSFPIPALRGFPSLVLTEAGQFARGGLVEAGDLSNVVAKYAQERVQAMEVM